MADTRMPYPDRIVPISINPAMATLKDIAWMAADLMEARRLLTGFLEGDDITVEAAVLLHYPRAEKPEAEEGA